LEESADVTFDLYAWKSPRDLDADGAAALLDRWHHEGGDPASSPFEPSTDVGWFYRELVQDAPGLETRSDAVPHQSRAPIWLATTDEAPARIVAMRVSSDTSRDDLDAIFGLAAKYDLVLFDMQARGVHLPLNEMAAHASATFWSAGAVQAGVAGGIGAAIAIVAWLVGIPVISGLLVLIGAFMFLMALYTFIHEGRKALSARRTGEDPPRG
jgi:hypothetical protein